MVLVGWAADGLPYLLRVRPDRSKERSEPVEKLHSSYRLKKEKREGGPGGKPDGTFTAGLRFVPEAGDLDECNGRFSVTPEFPEGTYAYHLTEEFPFVPRLWRGTPDPSFEKRGGPGGGPGGPGRPGGGPGGPGRPPRGGRPPGPGFPPPPPR